MKNFDFRNPTQILFGKDRVADLHEYAPADAARRIQEAAL